MCYSEKIINLFFSQFENKEKCPNCNNNCQVLCYKGCLNYRNNNIPNYDCDFLRYSYVLRYYYAHKAEIKKILSHESRRIIDHLELKNRSEQIICSSFGCGPGSDFFAIIEWLSENDLKNLNLKFQRLDKVNDWSNQYKKIFKIYEPLITKQNLKIETRKIIRDIIEDPPKTELEVAIFSYILSEYTYNETFQKNIDAFLKKIKDRFRDNSLIILNDRAEDKIINMYNYILRKFLVYFPNSNYDYYSFSNFFGKKHADKWCGESYPNDILKVINPTPQLNCNSYQMIIYLRR